MTKPCRHLGALEAAWAVPTPEALQEALAPDPDVEADFYALASEEEDVEGAAFVIYRGSDGAFRWRLVGADREVIATSGEAYADRAALERRLGLLRRLAARAGIVEGP